MYRAMIITEDRKTAHTLASYFDDIKKFKFSLVLWGSDAVETFIRTRPDIVVLDTNILIPYAFILEELRQINPSFSVILLGKGVLSGKDWRGYMQLDQKSITKGSFLSALTTLANDILQETPHSDESCFNELSMHDSCSIIYYYTPQSRVPLTVAIDKDDFCDYLKLGREDVIRRVYPGDIVF